MSAIAGILLSILLAPVSSEVAVGSPPDYLSVLSADCGHDPASESIRLVWHPEVDGLDPAASGRIFRVLQSPEVDRCLVARLEADRDLADRIRNQETCSVEDWKETQRRVREAWSNLGLLEALHEAAGTGKRGEKVRAFLDACDALP
jgi:hypothetical protein